MFLHKHLTASIINIPHELIEMMIPEQLLIAQHYPWCYIFKLFPQDYDTHLPPNQLYSAMAGNASSFKINTQEVVEMLKGQQMPSPVEALASVIAITFVGTRKLPTDWLMKTFWVRCCVVYEALLWLWINIPVYSDIEIDCWIYLKTMFLISYCQSCVRKKMMTLWKENENCTFLVRWKTSILKKLKI